MTEESASGTRIDRWLWCARFSKTRSQAVSAINAGHVRINDRRAKPGSRVVPGDSLRIVRDGLVFNVEVLTIPTRRGPAVEASTCYLEDDASRRIRESAVESVRQDRKLMPRTEGRPDKRTRRKIRRFNRDLADD
jgi:ribosome-associated heat shock protein Hsp15